MKQPADELIRYVDRRIAEGHTVEVVRSIYTPSAYPRAVINVDGEKRRLWWTGSRWKWDGRVSEKVKEYRRRYQRDYGKRRREYLKREKMKAEVS